LDWLIQESQVCLQEQGNEGKSIDDFVKENQQLARDLEFAKIREKKLVGQVDHYKALSTLDEQTGILNTRGIYDFLDRAIKTANRGMYKPEKSDSRALSIAFLDLDGFGQHNKKENHIKGDEILKNFAEFVYGNLRPLDVVGRFGGDEFFIGLPYTPIEGAHTTLDRLSELMKTPDAPKISYTGGVVQYDPDEHETSKDLIADASGICMKGKNLEKGKIYSVIDGEIKAYSSDID